MEYSKHNIFSKIAGSEDYFLLNPLSGQADILDQDEARNYKDKTPLNRAEYVRKGYLVDPAEEIAKMQVELEYTEGFLQSVRKKLSNERFVQNAPAQVVDKERQKLDDAEIKAGVLKAQIEKLRAQA